MFLARIYGIVWILSILAFSGAFLTGYLSSIALIAFGKFFIGLIFIGLIAVLPSVAESFSPRK